MYSTIQLSARVCVVQVFLMLWGHKSVVGTRRLYEDKRKESLLNVKHGFECEDLVYSYSTCRVMLSMLSRHMVVIVKVRISLQEISVMSSEQLWVSIEYFIQVKGKKTLVRQHSE